MKTIARNRTKLINEIFASASCIAFDYENGYSGTPVSAEVARKEYERFSWAKLYDLGDGKYRVKVDRRCWYNLDTIAQPAPVAQPVEEQSAAQEPLVVPAPTTTTDTRGAEPVTTEKPTKEQLAKLPVWAQQAFAAMEVELRNAKGTISALQVALNQVPPEGAGGLVTWSNLDEDFALPDRCNVRFHEGGFGDKKHHRYIEVGFSSGNQSERVVVVRGSEGIVIQPQAGNVVVVRLRKQGLDE